MENLFISTDFSYNGITSTSKNIINVRTESGTIKQSFATKRSIVKEKVFYTAQTFDYGNNYEDLSFTLEITKSDGEAFTLSERNDLISWLFKKDYCEFKTADYPDCVMYARAVSEPIFDNVGYNAGTITIDFETNSPFMFYAKQIITLTNGQSTIINNNTNVDEYKIYYPNVEVTMTGDSSFSITNSQNGVVTSFTGLDNNETIGMNAKMRLIVTSKTGTYRYSNFNGNWLRLNQGGNLISVSGNCTVTITIQIPVLI